MDDDLGTPAAVAAIYDVVREGNKLLGDGPPRPCDRRRGCGRCSTCSASTRDPAWPTAGGGADAQLTQAVDAWCRACSTSAPRRAPAKDCARADAIRDRIKAAGIEIEDTPTGPEVDV